MTNLGKVLKMYRIQHSISQPAMARKCGVSVNFLSLVENGHQTPSLTQLEKFAEALEVSVAALKIVSTNAPIELCRKDREEYEKIKSSLLLHEILK